MYYLYLGRRGDFSSPESIIIQYQDHYYYRGKHTDWFEMEENEIEKMLSGKDNKYYAIEKNQSDEILSSWGGSQQGYKNMNIHHLVDHSGYGDSYDDEDTDDGLFYGKYDE